jgi:hypothetical protein
LRTLGVRNRTEAAYKAGNVVNSTGSTDAEGRGDKLDALPPRSSTPLKWA